MRLTKVSLEPKRGERAGISNVNVILGQRFGRMYVMRVL